MKNNLTMSKDTLLRALGKIIIWLVFMIIVLVNSTPFLDNNEALMDFGSFYAAGEKSLRGENPYDPNSEYIFEINFSRVGAGGKMVNLNPPISVIAFRLLTLFDPYQALKTWQIISAMLYVGSVLLLVSLYKENGSLTRLLWAFLLAGFWHTLVLGQIYILLLFFTALGWFWLKRGKLVLAGMALGLVVAIKPNFVIWPIFLLFSGYGMAGISSLLTAAIISWLPIFLLGLNIYSQWLNASTLRLETLIMPGNNSIIGLTSRFDAFSLGVAISVVMVIGLMIVSNRNASKVIEKVEFVSALGIIASLLASPISWTGYTILLLPVFFSLRRWTIPVMSSAAILAIPFQIVLQLFQRSEFNFILFGWLYGWGMLVLLGEFVRKSMMTRSIQTN